MLAELVENGLSLLVAGRRGGDLRSQDRRPVPAGRGRLRHRHAPEELARPRPRLRDEENFLVAPTRFLGHYVVGRLARQMSVQVDLGESPVSGITAPDAVCPPRSWPTGRTRPATRANRPGQSPVRSLGQPSPARTRRAVFPRAEPEPEPATVVTRPVAEPAPRPVPVARVDAPPTHRWPTEQESLLDPPSPQPVTVAAIANSAPYDPHYRARRRTPTRGRRPRNAPATVW